MSEDRKQAEYFGAAPPFPISRAVRAGDFVITCAMGDRVFTFEEALYDEHGRVVSTGARLQEVTFAEEVHGTFKALQEFARACRLHARGRGRLPGLAARRARLL